VPSCQSVRSLRSSRALDPRERRRQLRRCSRARADPHRERAGSRYAGHVVQPIPPVGTRRTPGSTAPASAGNAVRPGARGTPWRSGAAAPLNSAGEPALQEGDPARVRPRPRRHGNGLTRNARLPECPRASSPIDRAHPDRPAAALPSFSMRWPLRLGSSAPRPRTLPRSVCTVSTACSQDGDLSTVAPPGRTADREGSSPRRSLVIVPRLLYVPRRSWSCDWAVAKLRCDVRYGGSTEARWTVSTNPQVSGVCIFGSGVRR